MNALRKLRESAKPRLTVRALSYLADVDETTIRRVQRGNDPSPLVARKLCAALSRRLGRKISLDELLNGTRRKSA